MNPPTPRPPADGERLKASEYIGYALGDTASNLFFKTFTIFLPFYYVDVWGIPNKALLWITPVVGLIGAFTDPIMGLIADRTNTRWGKFRPYIFFGAIPYGICGYLMFAGPTLGTNGKILYAFITYTLMLTSYSVINVPYSSLLGVVSSSSRTRAVASSFRFVGAFAGGLLISLFVRPLVKYLGTRTGEVNEMRASSGPWRSSRSSSVIMFWMTFATTKERVTPPPQQKTNVREELGELLRNWPWVVLLIASILSTTFIALQAGSTIFYFKYVVGDDESRSSIYSPLTSTAPPSSFPRVCWRRWLARWCWASWPGGWTRNCARPACARSPGVCFMTFYFLPKDRFDLLVAVNVIGYLCMGPTSALTWALYGDVADYGEWKFGRRSTGLVFSASLFAIKTGNLVGGFLLPLFLACFGYVKDADQTPKALLGITLAFSLVPGFIALLKATTLMIYPLNQKRVDEVERALAARRATASPEMTAL